jgi:outer membrane protein assembly factor BamB
MRKHHPATAALITLLALAITCPIASAEQSTRLLWQKQGVENVVSATWIEDLDGDAVADVLFESYDSGAPATDHLFAISGRSSGIGTVIWSARPLGGPSNSGGYGEYCLDVSPDLTGDGVSDVLYGAAWGNRSAFLLDGMSGATVWSFDTYEDSPPSPPESGWVYAVSSLGSDITGDALPEVLFCAGSENHCVYCADAKSGEILWHYRGQDAFGYVASIADVDRDGVRDVLAAQIDN